jgi:hypothetical protein
MGMGINIFGYIECPGYGWQREDQRVFRQNRRVIEHLPESDLERPFITRSMFSLLPLRKSSEVCIPQYEFQLIHFAGSYRNMFVIEAEWLSKFESILSGLCWLSAAVIKAFAGMEYCWHIDFAAIAHAYQSDPPRPPKQWSFEVHKLERLPIEINAAIDGIFASKYHIPPDCGT